MFEIYEFMRSGNAAFLGYDKQLHHVALQIDIVSVLVVKHVLLPTLPVSLSLHHAIVVLVVFIDDVLVDAHLLLLGMVPLGSVVVDHGLEVAIEIAPHLT